MIRVIHPEACYWAQEGYDLQSIYKHVARCARVCYQSNAKDGELPYEFLKRVILRGKDIKDITNEDIPKLHLSVFEHGTVHLRIKLNVAFNNNIIVSILKNKFSKSTLVKENDGLSYYYITTNMRVIIENKFYDYKEFIDDDNSHTDYYPERLSISILTDIGCSRELNRHRTHSVSEESTRYCRYTANKFGGNISILRVPWIPYTLEDPDDLVNTSYETGFYNDNEIFDSTTKVIYDKHTYNWNAVDWFLYGVQISNLVYSKCIELGWTAQQAREILPLNTKTQLIHTAFLDDWKEFIKLRLDEVSGKVHPVMKDLALRIQKEINKSCI